MRIAAALVLSSLLSAAEGDFTIQPASVYWNASANYDEHGKYDQSHQNLSLDLQISAADPGQVAGIREVVYATVQTDSGESLVPEASVRRRANANANTRQGRTFWRLHSELTPPTQPFTGFTTVSGKVIVRISDGPPQRARLQPLKDYLDRPLQLGDLADTLVITRSNRQLNLRGKPGVLDALVKIGTVDRNSGKENWFGGGGGRYENGVQVGRTCQDVAPEDALLLVVATRTHDIEVPFSFRDLRLADAPAKPVKAVPVTTTDVTVPAR